MNTLNFFEISLKNVPCLACLSEDDLRQLIGAIEIKVTDENFTNSRFVLSSNGTQVKFNFGSDGNFTGVTARVDGKNIPLFYGYGGNELSIFKGAPSSTSPGAGWVVEPDLSRQLLGQTGSETSWTAFLASRAPVLNTI